MDIPAGLKNISIEKILIKENAGAELREFIAANFRGARGCRICDFNTEPFLRDYCDAAALELGAYHADEYMLEAYDALVRDKNYDYFIACGAGTIHDITRVIAHEYSKPFISFPTAASCDGFVSNIAPVTTKSGMKITLPAVAPVAVFADTNIIANAPQRLTNAGIGDLVGKFIALTDWRIANLLIGEEIDKDIVDIVFNAVLGAIHFWYYQAGSIGEAVPKLLEALLLSGLCMQSMGNSRPASGAEHHIAHFLEMDIFGKNNNLHGENVAVGAALCHGLYNKIFNSDNIKFIGNYELDEELIKKYYGGLSDYIIKENQPAYLHKITPEIFYKNLGEIKKIIGETALYQDIPYIVSKISDGGFADAQCEPLLLKLAPYVRNRFTLLKLCRCLDINE